eukprot:scaffold487_cov344-Prasinococcus_capsulatus_cf.AAC.11
MTWRWVHTAQSRRATRKKGPEALQHPQQPHARWFAPWSPHVPEQHDQKDVEDEDDGGAPRPGQAAVEYNGAPVKDHYGCKGTTPPRLRLKHEQRD